MNPSAAATQPGSVSLLARMLERIAQVRREDVSLLVWSFLYFFCLLSAYYVLHGAAVAR